MSEYSNYVMYTHVLTRDANNGSYRTDIKSGAIWTGLAHDGVIEVIYTDPGDSYFLYPMTYAECAKD